jgi:hypothetical protein
VRFASPEWIAALVRALSAQPGLPRLLAGLGRDAAFVVEAEPPAFPRAVAGYGVQDGGRIVEARVLEDEDEILELEPAYVLRARYGIWKALLAGGDPVRAALTGQVRVQGDLEALVRRAGERHVVDAALRAVPTELP